MNDENLTAEKEISPGKWTRREVFAGKVRVLEKLKSSLLIFICYMCFATLALCIAYLINEEVKRILDQKREQRELESRLNGVDIDPVVDELYQS